MEKKKITIALLAVLGMMISGFAINAQEYKADVSKTALVWTGKKVGGSHTGNINLEKGSFTMKDGNITSGEFVIDMHSITNTDLEDEEYNQKLVGHLKSDDFFGVEKFPKARLTLTEVQKKSDGTYTVKGDLTIKEKTHPVEFEAQMKKEGDVVKFMADIVVDRAKYDVRYGSGSFFDNLGDKVIYDDFEIKLTLVAGR